MALSKERKKLFDFLGQAMKRLREEKFLVPSVLLLDEEHKHMRQFELHFDCENCKARAFEDVFNVAVMLQPTMTVTILSAAMLEDKEGVIAPESVNIEEHPQHVDILFIHLASANEAHALRLPYFVMPDGRVRFGKVEKMDDFTGNLARFDFWRKARKEREEEVKKNEASTDKDATGSV